MEMPPTDVKPVGGISLPSLCSIKSLLRHDDAVDDVDHTVRLHNVRNSYL